MRTVVNVSGLAFVLFIAACGTQPPRQAASAGPAASSSPSSSYYLDDGPAAVTPANLDAVPDAIPRREALHRFANRPYVVFGREYVPATALRPYREQGIASWYGRKFHGQRTATGEPYDMFAMTAAHPTLPVPSYARVSNPANGRSVVVRVNDRGPFLHDRLIDLSYAAAYRLGIAQRGSGLVEVEAIVFDDAMPTAIAALPAVLPAGAREVGSEAALSPPGALPGDPAPQVAPPLSVPAQPVAPTASAAPAATEGVPLVAGTGGFVVQLGAFASNANAQAFVNRLVNQSPPVRVDAQIRQMNGLFRVFVGPFATREEARRAGERLRVDLGLPSTIAVH